MLYLLIKDNSKMKIHFKKYSISKALFIAWSQLPILWYSNKNRWSIIPLHFNFMQNWFFPLKNRFLEWHWVHWTEKLKKKLNINYRDFLCTSSPTHKTGVVHTRMCAHTHTHLLHYQHPPLSTSPTRVVLLLQSMTIH